MEYMHENAPPPTLNTHNVMLVALGKVAKFDEARGYLATMRDHGIKPDIVSYNILLNIGAELGDITETIALLEVSSAS